MVLDRRLQPLPPRLRDVLAGRPLSRRNWPSLLREPFRPHPPGPRSVFDFVEQRFGFPVADRLADLLTLGVYGAPARKVGFEAAFPDLARDVAERGSLLRALLSRARRARREPAAPLVSTPAGIAALCEGLAARLGEGIRLGTRAVEVQRAPGGYTLRDARGESYLAQAVVLAVPPSGVPALAEAPRAARWARSFRARPQLLASFALEERAAVERFRSFGFLSPTRERLPLYGCLFPSAIFEGRAPSGALLLTVFVAPSLHAARDETLSRELAPLLQRLLGSSREPRLLDVARHPEGIWLYDRRHRERTRALRRHLQKLPRLELCGWAYDGVGVGDAVASGLHAADRIASSK
jgi:oxygen-dependent protoporphyrinogen oxidase